MRKVLLVLVFVAVIAGFVNWLDDRGSTDVDSGVSVATTVASDVEGPVGAAGNPAGSASQAQSAPVPQQSPQASQTNPAPPTAPPAPTVSTAPAKTYQVVPSCIDYSSGIPQAGLVKSPGLQATLQAIAADFESRGMLRSGAYIQAVLTAYWNDGWGFDCDLQRWVRR